MLMLTNHKTRQLSGLFSSKQCYLHNNSKSNFKWPLKFKVKTFKVDVLNQRLWLHTEREISWNFNGWFDLKFFCSLMKFVECSAGRNAWLVRRNGRHFIFEWRADIIGHQRALWSAEPKTKWRQKTEIFEQTTRERQSRQTIIDVFLMSNRHARWHCLWIIRCN